MAQKRTFKNQIVDALQNNHICLLFLQVIILIFIKISVRTPLVWLWSTMSFVPPLLLIMKSSKNVILLSLILLFVSQHALYALSQPDYGFSYGGDTIHDFHVASVLYDQPHFDFGHIGYAERSGDYSDYPMIHLFAVMTSKITGVTLYSICRFLIPVMNAVLVSYCFFTISSHVFDSDVRTSGLTTLVYGTLFYLNFKHGQFVRETFAFPLAFLALLYFVKMQNVSYKSKYFAVFTVFFFVTFLSHHFTSYMLLLLLVLFFVSETLCAEPSLSHKTREWGLVFFMVGAVACAVLMYWNLDYFMFHWNATVENFRQIISFVMEKNLLHTDVMEGYPLWRMIAAVGYFVTVLILSVVGWVALMKSPTKKGVLTFFLLLFCGSLVLRAYAPVHSLSWGYSLAKRSTVWSFIGLSYLVVKGWVRLSGGSLRKAGYVLVIWLAFASFSPYPQLVTDSTVDPPITYERYTSCVWLENHAIHGQLMAIPSRKQDPEYFDIAQSMAAYAYLKEYNLTWAPFDRFSGYICLLPERQLPDIDTDHLDAVYDNGSVRIITKSTYFMILTPA